MVARSVRSIVGALLLVLGLSGCVPSDPASHLVDVAVRSTGVGVEILYTSCAGGRPTEVAVLKSPNQGYDVSLNPPIWKIGLPSDDHDDTFLVGHTPTGATEEVHLDQPLARNAVHVAVITLAGGVTYDQPFELSEMGSQVAFNERYISESE